MNIARQIRNFRNKTRGRLRKTIALSLSFLILTILAFSLAGCKKDKEVLNDNTDVFKMDGTWDVRVFQQGNTAPSYCKGLTYKFFDHYTSEGHKFRDMYTGGKMVAKRHEVSKMVKNGKVYRKYGLKLDINLWMDTFPKVKFNKKDLSTYGRAQRRSFTGYWQDKFSWLILKRGKRQYVFTYEFHGKDQLTLYSPRNGVCRPNTMIVLKKQ